MFFQDRRDAGRALARALRELSGLDDAIVLALPRGGVPVAFEVARALRLPLDVFVVRKLGVPGEEELAMGALASGGVVVLNHDVVQTLHIRQSAIDAVIAREQLEIERREALYRAGRPPLSLQGRTVILVDDGLATGSTMKAAVRALRPVADRLIVAIPVAAAFTCAELRTEVDDLVCLHTPGHFFAVGQFYRHFDQTTDDEVRTLLAEAQQPGDSPQAA
jgi:predicted phosphoribosyltransferase